MRKVVIRLANSVLLQICAVMLFAGCSGMDVVQDQELAILQKDVAREPSDVQAVGRLADAYMQRYSRTRSPRYRDLAIEQYRRFLELSPKHPAASLTLYQIMLSEVLRNGNLSYQPEMRKLYSQVGLLRETNQMPPSTAEALLVYATQGSAAVFEREVDLLNKGVRENPADISTRMLMAKVYLDQGYYDLALAVIRQAKILANDEQEKKIRPLFAKILFEMSDSHKCATKNAYLDEGLQEVKAAYALDPKDTDMEYRLGKLYAVKELYQLSLFTMQDLVSKEPTPENRLLLAEYLWYDGRDKDALDLYDVYLNDPEYRSFVLEQKGRILFGQGHWRESASFLHQYLENTDRPEVYPVILLYLAEAYLGNREIGFKELAGNLRLDQQNDWQSTLIEYYLGGKSANEVTEAATDICREVEAYYYVAMNELISGDSERVKEELKRVVELNLPQYYEHHLAKRSLQRMGSD